MKVVFVSPASGYYEDYSTLKILGTEYQIYGLAKALVKKGYEVLIIRRWYSEKLIENIAGVKIINVYSPHFRDEQYGLVLTRLTFSKYVSKLIEKIKPDAVILTNKFTAFHVVQLKFPTIFVMHEIPYDLKVSNSRLNYLDWLLKRPFNITFENEVLSKASFIVALNSDLQKYLEERYENVVCIPNGIDIVDYIDLGESSYILFIGRISNEKGVHLLLNAYSLLFRKHEVEDRLIIIGPVFEISYANKILRILKNNKDLKKKVFVKFRYLDINESRKIMGRAKIFVMPSFFETFGLATLEAMASSKPVVASDISSFKALIKHNYNGLLFKKGNVDELMKCLEMLIFDPNLRKRIGMNARIVAEKYSFDAICKQYISLFYKL